MRVLIYWSWVVRASTRWVIAGVRQVVAGCWSRGSWMESLVCLECLCDVGFGGVDYLAVVGLLVRGMSEGIMGSLGGWRVGFLGEHGGKRESLGGSTRFRRCCGRRGVGRSIVEDCDPAETA